METNQKEPVVQSEENSVQTEKQETLSKADADYKRDMFRFKDEAKALREQLREIELEKQRKNGDLEGVIQALKDENKSLKHKNATERLSYAQTQLDSSIKQELLSRGLKGKKLDAFMKLVDDNDRSIVELDEGFNVNREDIKSLVDKNMERYGDLFKKEVKIVDGVPNNNAPNNTSKKLDITKMSWEEAVAYAKTLEK
jgi:hypothetical protein